MVRFRGAMNPAISGTAPLALGDELWRAWRLRDRLSLWAPALFRGHLSGLFPARHSLRRIFYLYYLLPALPAVPVLWHHVGPARPTGWVSIAAVLLGFLGFFPFRYFW